MRRNDPDVLAQWRERLDRFESSHVSLADFCQAEAITASAFYYWRRKLSQPATRNEHVEPSGKSSFLPVQVAAAGQVEFAFPNGTMMRLPAGDLQLLKLAIASIAQLDFDRGDD